MPRVLVIDDDQYSREILFRLLKKSSLEVTLSANLFDGIRKAQEGEYDLIFLDVYFQEGNALEKLDVFLALPNSPEIIILTGSGDPESAERALYSGAFDYILKPINAESLRNLVKQALASRQQYQQFSGALRTIGTSIIGQSPRIKYCLSMLLQAAATDSNCLILGETGTGKEIFARAIHTNGPRVDRNFVVIDCTNIPQNLAESILFGHNKGAFTDAQETREGLFMLSNQGTLFLDEIGDLPLVTQKSLLRVLQDKCFRPIGSKTEVSSDFRVIAATNRDLLSMVSAGTFRNDLYYRLSSIVIPLPPLRERVEDIEPLLRHYLAQTTEERGLPPKELSSRLLDVAKEYPWPGNVRELINSVHAAVTHAGNAPVLDIYDMPLVIRVYEKKSSISNINASQVIATNLACSSDGGHENGGLKKFRLLRRDALDSFEKDYIAKLSKQANGDIKLACELSGLSRARLYELLKKHNSLFR
jgi:two-component system NtrC family response regulator